MTRPTDEQLEAMAVRMERYSSLDVRNKAAAMLRACKAGDAPDHSDWNAAIEAAALTAFDCVFYDAAGSGFDEDKFNTAIRTLKKGPHDE